MQKSILLLATIALVAGLPTFSLPTTVFNGTGSFGVAQSSQLVGNFIAPGGVYTTSTIALGTNVAFFSTVGLSVTFTVSSGSAVGNFSVYLTTYTGASYSAFTGVTPAGSAGGASSGSAGTSFGLTYYTNLTAGSFTFNVTVTPSATVLVAPVTLSSNLQLFYAVNTTDGGGNSYSSGYSNNSTFFGALPSSITYSGATVSAITFQLPPVAYAVVTFASVDLTVGATGSTPAVFPVLYGTAAKVVANAQNVYVFSSAFALSLLNTVATNVSTIFNTAYNSQVGLTAGASTSVATNASVGGLTFNSSNTVYAGVSYNVTVADQVGLASTLVQNTSKLAIGYGNRFVWAFYNTTSGLAQILTDSVYNSTSATVSVSVTHFSSYAVYSTNSTSSSSDVTSTSSTSSTSTSSTFTTSSFTTSKVTSSTVGSSTSPSGAAASLVAAAMTTVAAVVLML